MEEHRTTTASRHRAQEPYFLPLYCPHQVWLANILTAPPDAEHPPQVPSLPPAFVQQLRHRRCRQCQETVGS